MGTRSKTSKSEIAMTIVGSSRRIRMNNRMIGKLIVRDKDYLIATLYDWAKAEEGLENGTAPIPKSLT